MIVAQLVQARISRTIPNSAPNLFAGQALSRANSPVTSTAGSPTVLGILEADLPAKVPSPQTNGVIFNSQRTVSVATNGRLAIRTADAAAFAALAPGASFGLVAGQAVAVGVASAIAATTINGGLLVVDEKIMGADGIGYILVFFN